MSVDCIVSTHHKIVVDITGKERALHIAVCSSDSKSETFNDSLKINLHWYVCTYDLLKPSG